MRSGSFGPVFAGRYLPVHLPDVFCRAGCLFGLSLIARLAGALAGRPLIVRLAEGASQSRSCRASLGLADVSEPSGRGGTTMRLFVRRGFGPGRLLTGWFLSGVALVRGGVEPTWLRAGRLRIPRRSYGDATGSPPTRSGEVGAAVGLEAYAFGFEQLPLPRPSGDGAACAVDDPVAGQTRRGFGERAAHPAGVVGHAPTSRAICL